MPRIVHQDVDSAELFSGCRDDLRAIGFSRQIRCGIAGPSPGMRNRRRCRGEFLFRARCKKHGCAFFRKKLSDGPADSTAGTGNQGNAILEFHRENEDSRKGGKPGGWEFAGGWRVACWPTTVHQVRCISSWQQVSSMA